MPDSRAATAPCPELAELMLASEGELPKRRQAEVTAHLRQCAACRNQLGGVGLALREYQDAVSDTDAGARAAEADASVQRLDVFRDRLQDERRAQSARVRLPARKWVPVAAAIPLIVGALVFSNRYTSVLRAEELLTKAAAQEQTVPADTVRRLEIHIKRTGVRTTRDVGASTSVVPISANAADAELTRRLEASRLDPRDPLSIRAFRAWHDSLRTKSDTVRPVDGDALALHTETSDGLLRSVELIVRRVDFQPLRATFAFTDFGDVEIVELSRWIAPASSIVAERIEKPAAAAAIAVAVPSVEALDEAELDVRQLLHQRALDGDPAITVARAGHVVEVRGGVAPDLASSLTRMPYVQVTRRAAAGASAATPRLEPQLGRWLDRTFRSSEQATTFLPTLTRDVERMRRQSDAFARLASRYSEGESQKLSPAARKKLDALTTAYRREIVSGIESLDTQLAFFLGTPTRPTLSPSASPWQADASSLHVRLERLETALRAVLRQEDLPLPTEMRTGTPEPHVLSDLRQALDAVWEQLQS